MPLPIKFWCEVASKGYQMKDGKISEKEIPTILTPVKYHGRPFSYDAIENFQWVVNRFNETNAIVDEAIIDFTNAWGHIIYIPSFRFPDGKEKGKPQPKEQIFDMPYRGLFMSLKEQLDLERSVFIGRGIALEYRTVDGKVMPCAIPNNLMWAIFYEYKTNPPQEYFTCEFYKRNGKRSRPRRGIDPVTKQPRNCPVGCRVLRTHPKNKWGEGCRKAWDKREERKAKLIHNDGTHERMQTQKKGTE